MVQPGNIVFTNTSAKPYTFTGGGSIGGTASLTVSGGGTVTLAYTGTDKYSGPTQINSGTLQIGDGGS